MTLDNAANNKPAVDSFVQHQDHGMLFGGVDFHVRCSAHILNILAQDGARYVHKPIEKIRELLRHIASSPLRIQSFNVIATNLDLPEKAKKILSCMLVSDSFRAYMSWKISTAEYVPEYVLGYLLVHPCMHGS